MEATNIIIIDDFVWTGNTLGTIVSDIQNQYRKLRKPMPNIVGVFLYNQDQEEKEINIAKEIFPKAEVFGLKNR